MKQVLGVLAHVDAGKTTFSERVLYASNAIRTLGRVDHQNAFLDAHPMVRVPRLMCLCVLSLTIFAPPAL